MKKKIKFKKIWGSVRRTLMRHMVKKQQELHRREDIGSEPRRVLMGRGELERTFQFKEMR